MALQVGMIGVGSLGLAIADGLIAPGIGVTGYRRGAMAGFQKGMELVGEATSALDADCPLLTAATETYAAAIAAGFGADDQSAVVEYLAGNKP